MQVGLLSQSVDFPLCSCLSPVKGLVNYCTERLACLNDSVNQRVSKSLSYSKLLGEILYEFVQGAGFIGLVVGLCLIGVCLKQKGKEKETVTL